MIAFKYFQKRDILYAIVISVCLFTLDILFWRSIFESQINSVNYLNSASSIFWDLYAILLKVFTFPRRLVWEFLNKLDVLMSFGSIKEYELYRTFVDLATFLADVVWWVFVIQMVKGWRRKVS